MIDRRWMTRKNFIVGAAVLVVVLFVAGFYFFRRPPRAEMERYVPAAALAFLEVDSLSDLTDGLTGTTAWRELAPVLGLSSQIKQVGFLADLMGRTGLGPDEAVLLGRAQCAVVLTGVESKAGETEDGPYVHLRPDFALIVESHLSPQAATRLVHTRGPIIAQRIYGDSVEAASEDYRGSELLVFHGPGTGHQLIAASAGSVMLIANQPEAMKSCLDAIAGRAATLAEDSTLKQMRPEVDGNAAVFGYVTGSGLNKLFEIWPALLAGRSTEPETVTSFTDLLQHISEQSATGLLYASEFKAGGVTEKYLTVLRPEVGEALAQPFKPASGASLPLLASVPRSIERLTLLDVKRPGELPEHILKQLSPHLDVVAGVALREFVINLRKQYGLEPSDSLGDSVGDEITLVNFGDESPSAMLIPVTDKAKVQPAVWRYLKHNGATVTNEGVDAGEIMISSSDDRRAAAFVDDNLVLGTRDQIAKVIETRDSRGGIDGDEGFKRVLSSRPAGSSIISYRPRSDDAPRLLLALSKLTRVTDGSRELLERDSARAAIERLPGSASFTEFRNYGVYVEARSAVGSFSLIGSLVKPDQE
ncbi:MAG TPA: hypothetical protein VLM38_16400 [Blastocatellia bacterium]|nr:hypothetical protein [Blastocatellia bacterium]